MQLTLGVSVDIPSLAEGAAVYGGLPGLTKRAEPYPGVAVLVGQNIELCLLERPPGSKSSMSTADVRRYERHWTPIHLDVHVDDLDAAAWPVGPRHAACVGGR